MSTELDNELKDASYAPPLHDFPTGASSRSRRLWRAALWGAVVVLIVGGVALFISRRARAVSNMHYETANADRGTIAAKITATGTLSALLTVQVGSQVSGRVQQLFVDWNSPVKKGETVAKLDPLLFQAAVEQARANLLSTEATLKKDQAQATNAKLIYDRTKNLAAAKVMAQSDLDTASANYDAAKAQVDADQSNLESAQATLNQTEVNLGYTTVVSPIDGTVISRNVDVGQTVAASLAAPTLFVIAQDLHHMQVDTNVGEADVGRLTAGMPATFTVDAYPNKPFTGKVRQIRNAAQSVQNVVTYDAVIDVENPNLLLKPGMTANCTFVAAQKDNVVRLTNSALRFQPDPLLLKRIGITDPTPSESVVKDPNRKVVWVLRDNKPVRLVVFTGVTDGTWTELVQGDVKSGDVLITDMTPSPRQGLF
jgi:HlyD family secretion protein